MPCGSCGQSRQVINQQEAQSYAAGKSRPIYIVTAPDGTAKEFSDYGLAAIYRREVDGSMTTTTALKQSMLEPMVALYALVESCHEGKIAESELIFSSTLPDGSEHRVEIIVRNTVRPMAFGPAIPLGDE